MSQVVAAIGTAKAALKFAGFNGPVTTVDTMSKHHFRGFRSVLLIVGVGTKERSTSVDHRNDVFFATIPYLEKYLILTLNLPVAIKNNIELCTASDFCAINCHAFFDGNTYVLS